MTLEEKLAILTDAAKYDVSCSSSGGRRKNTPDGIGNSAPAGICHSWSADGRCVSLLKILLSNACVYDCDYCINRRSHDTPRATFDVQEVVDLTMNFYRRNYIEGLFLSSGVLVSPDVTMERLIAVAERLRHVARFNGYLHFKAIPGAAPELVQRLGALVDRLSVNIELPTRTSLAQFAPEKSPEAIAAPMAAIAGGIHTALAERHSSRRAPLFVPAGQTTQMIIGASPESDHTILQTAEGLYKNYAMKRVYYSAFVPTGHSTQLVRHGEVPLQREHRLYQADFLLRFYHFRADELLDDQRPWLDERLDPKAVWALNHPAFFPVDVNTASEAALLRVPGLGPQSARRIIRSRRLRPLQLEDLRNIGVVMKRARFFITAANRHDGLNCPNDTVRLALSDASRVSASGWVQAALF